jgi:hypothetical protein
MFDGAVGPGCFILVPHSALCNKVCAEWIRIAHIPPLPALHWPAHNACVAYIYKRSILSSPPNRPASLLVCASDQVSTLLLLNNNAYITITLIVCAGYVHR